ncbi:MAG: hypothetical protein HUJ98_00990 [Bacteroidaceae bacterium]|nr:hypothetical protein [Bacteroidaceae bacterium]
MSVELKDNTMKVKAEINRNTLNWLEEMAGLIESRTKQNTKGGGSGLRDKWQHVVDESKGEAIVGHPWQLAIWYELGTGKYAINGDGRKGYWVYVKDGSDASSATAEYPSSGQPYTLQEAKRICAMLRSKGLEAYYTDGQEAHRPLEMAFENNKEFMKKNLEERLKGMK